MGTNLVCAPTLISGDRRSAEVRQDRVLPIEVPRFAGLLTYPVSAWELPSGALITWVKSNYDLWVISRAGLFAGGGYFRGYSFHAKQFAKDLAGFRRNRSAQQTPEARNVKPQIARK